MTQIRYSKDMNNGNAMNRYQVCLGYYHYAVAYNGTKKAASIWRRLNTIGYRPSPSEEYSEALREPENAQAESTYIRLLLS